VRALLAFGFIGLKYISLGAGEVDDQNDEDVAKNVAVLIANVVATPMA
jgi:hypothetical protein